MKIKPKILGFLYRKCVKPLLFLIDPEKIHDEFLRFGSILGRYGASRFITEKIFNYQNSDLRQEIAGITFENPIGLAAGFDKNGQIIDILPAVGFGFEEMGSVSAFPCKGNEKPRLWRLKKSKGLVVNYGLMNDGAVAISKRLFYKKLKIPLGISIAKTNCAETADTEKGIQDYVSSFRLLKNLGNYITINISCPNAFGGQPFTDGPRLEKLLTAIAKEGITRPIFIKLSPDLSKSQLSEILAVTAKFSITGFICTNLTKDRSLFKDKILDKDFPERGGISGKPVSDLSDEMIKNLYQVSQGKYVIIGCGGVFSAEDAYRKIRLGASLIQLITGMIFQGPQLIGEINRGLTELIKKDGYKKISEAIGVDNKIV